MENCENCAELVAALAQIKDILLMGRIPADMRQRAILIAQMALAKAAK